ncbi:MAG: VOC family protein [Beijerinckiaceae bacterium]
MASPHGSFIWYELMTPDTAGSKAFYEAVVGWRMMPGQMPNPGYGFITNADGGMTGGVLTLTPEMQAQGARPCWLGYIGVDDCDAAVAQILALGGRVLMPARDVEMAGRIALMADPDGAAFYIMTPKPPQGAEQESTAFAPKTVGRCAWNELLAGNQSGALAFYTGLFGWSLPEPMDMGAMGKYQFISHGDAMIGAIMQKPAEAPVPLWNHYFNVANITAAVAAVKTHGGRVLYGPMEVPGGDHIIQGLDPQGAFFCLVGPQ